MLEHKVMNACYYARYIFLKLVYNVAKKLNLCDQHELHVKYINARFEYILFSEE